MGGGGAGAWLTGGTGTWEIQARRSFARAPSVCGIVGIPDACEVPPVVSNADPTRPPPPPFPPSAPAPAASALGKGPVGKKDARSKEAALFTRIIRDIVILESSLAGLRRSFQAFERHPDSRLFRRLWEQVSDALSFLAVLAARAEGLDPARQALTLIRLGQLREMVVEQHLSAVEPLLSALAQGQDTLTLGTDYVMNRWLSHLELTWADLEAERRRLDALRQSDPPAPDAPAPDVPSPEMQALADEDAAHQRVTQALERSAQLARAIIAAAPGLADFSKLEPEPDATPLLTQARPQRSLPALPSPPLGEGGDAAQADRYGVIFLHRRDGSLWVDSQASVAGIRALRVGGKMDAVARAMGIPRHRLTTMLAGSDALSFTQLTRLQTALEQELGSGVSARLADT